MKIRLDFEGNAIAFSKPIDILMTHSLTDIEPYLAKMSAYIEQGYYVAGYLAYESAMAFNAFNHTKDASNNQFPLMLFGVFDQYSYVNECADDFKPLQMAMMSDSSRQVYDDNIRYIREQIKAGNSYQTNFTIKFNGKSQNDPYHYYQFLQKNNQANYCAYIEFEDMHILSISPELFFKLDDQHITTKPMKGTAARGKTLQEDERQRKLLFSEKNQAENMMIVDLLRNDLSQISKPGSVTVTALFTAEKYPTVWQLTSTIESVLKEKTSLYQIFQALFPCGSITGAPKASTMEIIAEIEHAPREVYCGTIGYISPQRQQAIFNIPIRTLTIKAGNASYGVGGGITWDSTEQGEYDELLQKTAILNRFCPLPTYLIESLLLENGQFLLLKAHLSRLNDSAQYFSYPFNYQALKFELVALAKRNCTGSFKVRVKIDRQGTLTLDSEVITQTLQLKHIALSPTMVNSFHLYLYHKTSNRSHFPTISAGHEFLSHNENGEITEFVNGNVVVLLDNKWLTPPISCGLLPGTMRQFYLDNGRISEQVITLTDLKRVEKMVFINSVRQWIEIDCDVLRVFKHSLNSELHSCLNRQK